MTDGFFKLQRRFFTHWLWKEERVMSRAEAFLDLLQLACFMPTKQIVSGKVLEVPRGGMLASERYLATRWGWSRKRVRVFLDVLEEQGMIGRSGAQDEPMLTLCNYERWNDAVSEKGPAGAQPGPSEGPNNKKEKKGENDGPACSGWASCDEVKRYAREAPFMISADCAVAFHDEMEAFGWTRKGQPIRDWRAALRSWARHWNDNRRTGDSRPPRPRPPHQHRQEKSRREFPESRTTTLPSA